MNLKQWILLLLILMIAVFLRFWQLGETPKGFYLDEAALGYNAYSVMETGKDEFGKKWPILFRSFGDFKAPIYSYLLIPMYKFFGVSVWSTRALSAISGVISIWFSFWLIKNLSKNSYLSLTTVLLMAISPWHLIFSRTSYETNVAFTFLIISLWSFYKSKQNKNYFVLCGLMAVMSFLTYHSERVIVPLIFLFLIIRQRRSIFRRENIKSIAITIILGLVLILPTVKLMTTPGFLSRLNSLSIFSENIKRPWGYDQNFNGWKNIIFNNKYLLEIREFASLYTSYFSPRYLFGLGDPGLRSSYPDMAPFLFWQLPFLIIGFGCFFRKGKKIDDFKFLIILLLIISPIPASVTKDPFSSIRSLPMLMPLVVLVAIGTNEFVKKFKKMGYLILMVLIIWSFGKIYLSVFKFNDFFREIDWNSGAEEMVKMLENKSLPIVIDNGRGEIYSQILFFTKFDPRKYQKNNSEVSESDYYTNMVRNRTKKINNITVREIVWKDDIKEEQILVGDNLAISNDQIKEHCLTKIFEIKALDGKIIYTGVATNPKLKELKGKNGCND